MSIKQTHRGVTITFTIPRFIVDIITLLLCLSSLIFLLFLEGV